MHRICRIATCAGLAGMMSIVASGCGVYRTTSRTAGDIQRVAVPYFANATAEPDVEIEITDEIIRGIVRDNTLKVVDESMADAVIEGTVAEFENVPYTFERGAAQIQADQYRLTVGIRVSLFNRAGNNYIYENKIVKAHGNYYLETSADQNYENALEEVYRDLVEGILSSMVQEW